MVEVYVGGRFKTQEGKEVFINHDYWQLDEYVFVDNNYMEWYSNGQAVDGNTKNDLVEEVK